MTLEAALEAVSSRETFIAFLKVLRAECGAPDWENDTLPRFLEAMSAWGSDTPDREQVPSWRAFADMLMAARVYE